LLKHEEKIIFPEISARLFEATDILGEV
jgi:hypothetical protein